MESIDYKKKYEQAIKRAKSKIKNDKDHVLYEDDVIEIFPELAEPEDEKVRKELINFVKSRLAGFSECEKFIAWIKKQGEHANFLNKIQIGDKVTRNEDGVLVNISQLNRVAKPADKVEPSFDEAQGTPIIKQEEHKPTVGFNIGDEITVNGRVCRVVAVDRSAWSIEDDLTLSDTIKSLQLCGMCSTDRYFWLQSLKNRIKFQPKQEWSEEDESTKKALSNLIGMYFLGCTDISGRDRLLNWLNALKERVQLQSQKQWKPTAEQMKFLWKYAEQNNYDGTILRSLYNDLEKLRDGK